MPLACRDLSQNALIGSLPPKWSALGLLTTLDVSSNYLAGSMPDSWGQLGSLQELRLAFNNLRVCGRGWEVSHACRAWGWLRNGFAVRAEGGQLVQSCLFSSSGR